MTFLNKIPTCRTTVSISITKGQSHRWWVSRLAGRGQGLCY